MWLSASEGTLLVGAPRRSWIGQADLQCAPHLLLYRCLGSNIKDGTETEEGLIFIARRGLSKALLHNWFSQLLCKAGLAAEQLGQAGWPQVRETLPLTDCWAGLWILPLTCYPRPASVSTSLICSYLICEIRVMISTGLL